MSRWPAMMKRRTLAEYVDMTEAAVEREVASGRLPQPLMLGGREHWSKDAVDRALAQLTGAIDIPDWQREFEERYGTAA